MRLFLLIALTMTAFAANSVLNRAAVGPGLIDATGFGTVRLWSGALCLAALCLLSGRGLRLAGPGRLAGVVGLVLYIYGFSLAYRGLDAGLGALILFGMVQITMFAGAIAGGERPPLLRWLGAALAFGGLVWLLWPGAESTVSPLHGLAMLAAGLGWGIYSLAGRKARDPLVATAANFLLAAPLGLLLSLALPGTGAPTVEPSTTGLALAVTSGVLTSGLGYALWYHVLPQITGSAAAVAQLTVPVLAMAGGMLALAEPLTAQFALAAVVVLGGVALSLVARK
jgi:drug/metabolite transporter (DMT)-like permease